MSLVCIIRIGRQRPPIGILQVYFPLDDMWFVAILSAGAQYSTRLAGRLVNWQVRRSAGWTVGRQVEGWGGKQVGREVGTYEVEQAGRQVGGATWAGRL